jgi:hypothetical protein
MDRARLPRVWLKTPSLTSEVIVTLAPLKGEGLVTLSRFLEQHPLDPRSEDLLYASFAPGVLAVRVAPLR